MESASQIEKQFNEAESSRLWSVIFEGIVAESNDNNFTFNEAKSVKNKNLNRYRDVNPYDHSRIILKRGDCDYINANLVSVERAHRKYILTQGPLSSTVSHFWTMVWEQESKAIIMLNKLIENSMIKCHHYWPGHLGSVMSLPDVGLLIKLENEINYSYYIVRTFTLTDIETNASREILHFHYMTWPDFGVPKSPKEFLRFLRAVRKSGALDENVGPPIVHCSAGIGRSGTFCLVDSCLVMIAEHGEESVDIRQVLLDLRKQRMGLVQQLFQLRFSWLSIVEGMKSDWLTNYEDTPELDDEKVAESVSDSDSDTPPPPPPRAESLITDKPVPSSPDKSLPSSPEDEVPPKPSPFDVSSEDTNGPVENGVEKESEDTIRQRKAAQTEKQTKLSEKVQEMKRKQESAEKWEQVKRSLKPYVAFILFGGGVLALYYFSSRQ